MQLTLSLLEQLEGSKMRTLCIGIVVLSLALSVAAFADPAVNDVSYKGTGGSYEQWATGVAGLGYTTLTVGADVEWYVKDTLDKSEVNFNFHDVSKTSNVATGTVTGHIITTIDGYLSVKPAGTKACDLLNMTNGTYKIPVTWAWSLAGGGSGVGVVGGTDPYGATLPTDIRSDATIGIPNGVRNADYSWTITAAAPQFAPTGHYVLDPEVAFVPAL
jgi:hypothetical protein